MLFDAAAELARIRKSRPAPANPAIPANLDAKSTGHDPQISRLAGLAAPNPQIYELEGSANATVKRAEPFTSAYGLSVAGNPKTWTGRVVSISEWRKLSEWDRHGPNGRLWNGLTRSWEGPQTDKPQQQPTLQIGKPSL